MKYNDLVTLITNAEPIAECEPRLDLQPKQLQWLDEHLCIVGDEQKYRRWRLQAIAARG